MVSGRKAFFSAAVLIVLALVTAAADVHAQSPQFSAEVTSRMATGQVFWLFKIFVRGDQMRVEVFDKKSKILSIHLLDSHKNTTLRMIPEQHVYVEDPGVGEMVLALHVNHPDNACLDGEEKARELAKKNPQVNQKPVTCRKIGPESINGRDTVKYEATYTNYKGQPVKGVSWVDRKIGFFIRMEGAGITTEITNIQETSQASSLFELPAGYHKYEAGKR
jgi:hypothetical protein